MSLGGKQKNGLRGRFFMPDTNLTTMKISVGAAEGCDLLILIFSVSEKDQSQKDRSLRQLLRGSACFFEFFFVGAVTHRPVVSLEQ
ncbi:hypothetical protein ACFS4T_07505 [Pseudomonas lini]